MPEVILSKPVRDFTAASTGDKSIQLSDFKGQYVLLYFYPKDNTPGCITEGQNFRDNIAQFEQHNTVILGVSRDSVRVHEGFKTKQSFPFDLLSDKEEELCNLFDVIKMKNMYGKQVRGIERSTFLIDPDGVLIHEWRKVKVKVHLDEVLQKIAEIGA
ncbi:MAG: peroxiredoxin [Gammaproteobacteria bacterium]|jgi:peroxiredoxin Q/BCP|nr:peroxiredoxin [Gammaproteobacteria bacterium]MBT4146601.1 peroxiredoxin [Gammaproteobacteria bacterium]MBT5223175.1 peroxiredoxin [Gammaproteobacteria bacterium]MBT5824690.1 peroxiredoxin [Gammaproteobacteria bacterium]MBT5967343.1 peroxiredoxin [Gammaproteobacteria bacterium]